MFPEPGQEPLCSGPVPVLSVLISFRTGLRDERQRQGDEGGEDDYGTASLAGHKAPLQGRCT